MFQTTSGDTLVLQLYYPRTATFPVFSLVGVKAKHPWLDGNRRVTGYPAIQTEASWRNSRVMLGTAVHEVVQHLQLHPPVIEEITDNALQVANQNNHRSPQSQLSTPSNGGAAAAPPPPPPYSALSWKGDTASPARNVPKPRIDMPPLPTTFPLLDDLSREEMQNMLDNKLDLLAFCNKLPSVQTLQTMKISVLDESEKIAKRNLEKEASYTSLQQQVEGLQKQLQSNLADFAKLEAEQAELCIETDPEQLVRELKRQKKKALEESEDYADEWVNGDTDLSVTDFLREFLEKRKVHHERAAKIEILERYGHI